ALQEDAARRLVFLHERCADPSVRAEVERLLCEHEQTTKFLSKPTLNDFLDETETYSQVLTPGELLAGRFRVVCLIASGGMGEVYEAEDLELHDRVAVKIIRPEILVQPNAMVRFKREVRLARRVTHPNVCRVFDLFRHQRPYPTQVHQDVVFIS